MWYVKAFDKRQISAVIFKNLSYINAQETYNKVVSCPSISVYWTLDQSFITDSLSKITWSRMILTFSHSLRKGLRMLTIFLPLRLFPVDVNTTKSHSGCAGWRFQLRKRIKVKKNTLETSSRFFNTSIFWLHALLVAWKLLPSTYHHHQAIRESREQRLPCWKGSCVSLQPANSWWF